jgi:hypothetical protein
VNGFKNNVKNRFKVYITQNLMKRMLHEEIREKQNLVYSISVQDYGITKIPDEKYTLVINFDCDPKNKDKIFTEIVPLRKFNVRRNKRGFKMISPAKRRFDFSKILKNN